MRHSKARPILFTLLFALLIAPLSGAWAIGVLVGVDLLVTGFCMIILAGAGMSVDSGLPDYRGDEGLWRESAHSRGPHT